MIISMDTERTFNIIPIYDFFKTLSKCPQLAVGGSTYKKPTVTSHLTVKDWILVLMQKTGCP